VKHSIFVAALVLSVSSGLAQTQSAPQTDWTPQAIQILGQAATSRSEFSFSHSMLVLASKPDQDDDSFRRVIAGVDGISVHRFRFQVPATYDPQLLSTLAREYHAAGWQHVNYGHNKDGWPTGTDVWFHLERDTIRDFALVFAGREQVSFVTVSGSISPLDLLHLAGHFGIPRTQGGVVMASPTPGQQPPPPPDSY
jgi:hypothetical protein